MYDEGNHGVKETCAITSAQVKKSNTYQRTYEIDHVSLLRDSTTSSALNFCFFYVFYCNLKVKNNIKRNINSKMFT